jgi:hypothetical protein
LQLLFALLAHILKDGIVLGTSVCKIVLAVLLGLVFRPLAAHASSVHLKLNSIQIGSLWLYLICSLDSGLLETFNEARNLLTLRLLHKLLCLWSNFRGVSNNKVIDVVVIDDVGDIGSRLLDISFSLLLLLVQISTLVVFVSDRRVLIHILRLSLFLGLNWDSLVLGHGLSWRLPFCTWRRSSLLLGWFRISFKITCF